MSKFAGYKTFAYNFLLGAVVFANQMTDANVDPNVVGKMLQSVNDNATGLMVVGNMILRAMTSPAMFKTS